MIKVTCTRRIQFCAGHRVMGHENKCAHLHGHNYVALITAEAEQDDLGRVIDFSVIKNHVGGWIDENWDHGFILYVNDHAAMIALSHFDHEMRGQQGQGGFTQKLYHMPNNPTAENMALHLLQVSNELMAKAKTGVAITKIRVWETENCYADAEATQDEDPIYK